MGSDWSRELIQRLNRISRVGEIRVNVRLENDGDRILCEAGHLSSKKIRRRDVEAIVDTGAVMLLLPQDVVEALGLKTFGQKTVVLADERRIRLSRAGTLSLTVNGREMKTDCLVGPPGCKPLVGQIVMEELDLIADPSRRTLSPRDPRGPILKMKRTRAVPVESEEYFAAAS